jgi:uncharacterized membrane protein
MNKTRFEAFSDGVFAIVVTLLAIELRPFHIGSGSDLVHLIPSLELFTLSFITIAIFWVNHHHVSHGIQIVTNQILWTNIVALLFVTLIPFATSLLGDNLHKDLALAFYASILFGASGSFLILRKVVHSFSDKRIILRSLVGPISYALAFIVAFVSIEMSYVLVLIPPVYYMVPRRS